MITQTIRVNLNQKELETILAVQSDTLREIAFEFYATDAEDAVQLDPDEFTVKLNMLKPDNNFVMTTFTDGIIKLSDQMTAVTGTGYYCILLLQDDELIYSGNGKIIINDHVIGTENIDSVSEADGYTFPDDFYTKDTPLAVLDDSTTSTTSTWSSSKISSGIASKASIDDNATNLTETWSSDKIATELNGKPDIDDTAQNTTDTWSSEKINSVVQSAAQIADNVISTTSTWSSNKINGEINTASTSAIAQLNAMKTGFDGVEYSSPAVAVRACDQKLQEQVNNNKLFISQSNINTPINILDVKKIIHGYYVNGKTGEMVAGSSGTGLNCVTDFLPVDANQTYYVFPGALLCNAVYYDSSKTYISGGMVSNATMSIPSTAAYVRMSFVNTALTEFASVSKIQVMNRYKVLFDNTAIKAPRIDTNCMTLGTVNANNPYSYTYADNRCITDLIWLEKTYIKHLTTNKLGVYVFTDNLVLDESYRFDYWGDHDELYIDDGRYVQFVFAYSDDRNLTTSDFSPLSATVEFETVGEKALGINGEIEPIYQIVNEWRNGSVGNLGNLNGISFVNIQPNHFASSITILIDKPLASGHKYRYQLTTYSIDSGDTPSGSSYRINYDITYVSALNYHTFDLQDGSIGFAIALYELDENDDYVPLRISTFDTSKISIIRNHDEPLGNIADYSIDAGFVKTPISLKYLGALSGRQSFCMYDGHYWSTDGEKLYEQDSSFNVVSTTDLLLGHANALQLGSDGKAYASGWNDDKVYVVDLATKTIVETITLPVNGYTTCAVDDANGLMYIFHRTTTSGTPTNYNFIVYDYINDNTISTKKTTRSYAAMQSCDFIDGKIFVLYGLGTDVAPNGYIVFNTVGDIIGEYIINSFSTNEPEGVFVDRSTYDVYISFVDFKLYKITQNN